VDALKFDLREDLFWMDFRTPWSKRHAWYKEVATHSKKKWQDRMLAELGQSVTLVVSLAMLDSVPLIRVSRNKVLRR